MAILEKPYWQWTAQEWVSLIHKTVPAQRRAALRGQVVVLAFHLGGHNVATQVMPNLLKSTQLVSLLWGSAVVEHSISLVRGYLVSIGYRVKETQPAGRTLGQTIVAAMLALNEPDVRRWDEAAYRALTRGDELLGTLKPGGKRRHYALSVALALHRLGIFTVDPQVQAHGGCFEKSVAGYTAEWGQWADRFAALSVAGRREQSSFAILSSLSVVGRLHTMKKRRGALPTGMSRSRPTSPPSSPMGRSESWSRSPRVAMPLASALP